MRPALGILLCSAALLGHGHALAQQRPATPPAGQRTPPAAAATQQAQQQQQQPNGGAVAQAQPVRTEIVPYENWTVTCRDFADKRRSCSAALQVVQQNNNQVLFVWVLGKNSDNKLMSVLQTPTGVTLAPGVEVKLSRGGTRKAAFVNCDSARCEAYLDTDDAFLREASSSETVEATLYSNTGQGVKFTLPFKGFDKALAAVR